MDLFNEKIRLTRPLLPELDQLIPCLENIWQEGWVTNNGSFHQKLETAMATVLNVGRLSLFNNGTIALLIAMKALDLPYGSEVITTPFTFAATSHTISWNGLTPVFCDVEPNTMTIDADKIESLITEKTAAILGVHVYGFPCDVEKIDNIAKRHHLKVIYDAAHAFSTEMGGKSIGAYGDMTMFSFHATKLFNTIEGGCLTFSDNKLKEKIDHLKNFGIEDEETVNEIGINGKMNELQAAVGLLNLELFEAEKAKRRLIRKQYERELENIPGIIVPKMPLNVTHSEQYFVIRIDQNRFGKSRDAVYEALRKHHILARKYFYPLCSDYKCYAEFADHALLPVANRLKHEVLCLPFYGGLEKTTVKRICSIINAVRLK